MCVDMVLCNITNAGEWNSITQKAVFTLSPLIPERFIGIITLYCKSVHPIFMSKTPKPAGLAGIEIENGTPFLTIMHLSTILLRRHTGWTRRQIQ